MTEKISAKPENLTEPSFKLNYATVILVLVILIPLVYTIAVNLQSAAPAPVITPVTITVQTPVTAGNAIENALKAVVDRPDFASYTNLGIAYYGAGKYEDAVKAWQKSLEYNPKSELAYNNIAAGYGALSNWDEEINACKKALEINPNFDLAKRNLAWATGKKAGK
ncbi:MAG: Tetratricopeptide 1 repeat-containing protein [Bacteroidota bacterium]|nr:Tetratricopeptide 1 repeat-containing protein [Bacteroidota bacterium]